jgi:hypothetical protein
MHLNVIVYLSNLYINTTVIVTSGFSRYLMRTMDIVMRRCSRSRSSFRNFPSRRPLSRTRLLICWRLRLQILPVPWLHMIRYHSPAVAWFFWSTLLAWHYSSGTSSFRWTGYLRKRVDVLLFRGLIIRHCRRNNGLVCAARNFRKAVHISFIVCGFWC